ncbi:mixed-lineage leukemia protein, putative [Ricinus communis]|uniref:Mixed-lineage leukemia protein, putative n=1 Tax=Ricinus communis TaxID=3988 RepID=B9SZ29_RICCO|nr:mixed-lineage leukemia protein, putative [Ricinus communis]|eukprot:XP_002531248.1 mst2 complex subunit nto1 [Ricinus communis]
MDTKFQALPPLKRLRLLQQQQQQEEEVEENKENETIISLQLPAKKRKESRYPLLPEPTTTYCLPAKKRVWAFQPDFISGNGDPLSPFDLNVEYKPSFVDRETKQIEDHSKIPLPNITLQEHGNSKISNQCETEEENKEEEENDDDEDDGILCAICQSTDGDPTDPIVFCDGCDLMVHTTCYGNPLIKGVPEGDWFCTRCLNSESDKPNTVSCCLCTTKDGALKPTTDGLWAHIVCAVLVPEVFFEDPDGREGINCSKVPKRRWEDKCCVCKTRNGCVIQCSEPKCHLAFHVTCGLNQDFCFEYKEGRKKEGTIVAGFCKTHTELWKKQQRTGKFKIVAREEHMK